MSRRAVYGLMMVAFIVGGIAGGVFGVLLFLRIVGGSDEPSAPINAPTLSLEEIFTATPTLDQAGTAIAQVNENIDQLATQVNELGVAIEADAPASLETEVAQINASVSQLVGMETRRQAGIPGAQVVTATATRTPRPTATPTLTWTPSPTATSTPTIAPNQSLFRIVSEESEVRFILDEDLEELIPGLETTVIGATNQVAGDIFVDLDNPANSRLGIVRINLRTLRTDNPDRDFAIRGEILLSARAEYEFTDFVPTALSGLPDRIAIGDTIEFQVTGNLSLRGVSRPVTFDARVTLTNESELNGFAAATVSRSDFRMPNIGPIADDEVVLEIEFVAQRVET